MFDGKRKKTKKGNMTDQQVQKAIQRVVRSAREVEGDVADLNELLDAHLDLINNLAGAGNGAKARKEISNLASKLKRRGMGFELEEAWKVLKG